jgi:putative Mg2+ transporter-C (MgtC) family protein
MLDSEQMLIKLVIAMALGILIGIEREFAGKEAGVRTSMLVASGATIFTMIGLSLPYIISTSPENLNQILAGNSGYTNIIANIVVGIGFIGAGIIIKVKEHIHGLTTAANIWTTAAIGVLVGIGLIQFAIATTILVVGLLFLLRKVRISEKVNHDFDKHEKENS